MRIVDKDQVEALGLTLADVVAGLRNSFLAARAGDIVWRPKSTINQADGAFLISTLACWPSTNVALFHNIMGTSAANVAPEEPHYSTLQILSDYRTGRPVAAIDGTFTSTMLPAGVTALAAARLAKPDARVATFVGVGVQAKVNLAALRSVRDIRSVKVLGRGRTSATAFADHAASLGLAVEVANSPEAAIRDSDVIVSSVPSGPGLTPFLDPAWVSPGAFVSAVDIGRSWLPGFETFERRVTDDRLQAEMQHREGRMNYGGSFTNELGDLIAASETSPIDPGRRSVIIHPGNVVGVIGITMEVWKELRAA
jgi:ornithine cyclodeaminase/alanine dehydrogenase